MIHGIQPVEQNHECVCLESIKYISAWTKKNNPFRFNHSVYQELTGFVVVTLVLLFVSGLLVSTSEVTQKIVFIPSSVEDLAYLCTKNTFTYH